HKQRTAAVVAAHGNGKTNQNVVGLFAARGCIERQQRIQGRRRFSDQRLLLPEELHCRSFENRHIGKFRRWLGSAKFNNKQSWSDHFKDETPCGYRTRGAPDRKL